MDSSQPVAQLTHDPYASMRIPEYRYLIIGRFTFIMALRMMSTLVGWWVFVLTNDAFAIGLVGLAEVIPALSLALYSGHVVDISRKRTLLLRVVFLYTVAAAMLLFLATPWTNSQLGNQQITWGIYAVIFFTGIIRSFTGPVFSSILANIVPRQLLQNATTWSQGAWLSAAAIGHAMGGFLIAGLGIMGALGVICAVLIVSILILWNIKSRPPASSGEKKTWESVKEGLLFVFRSKELLGAMSLDMFAVLFGGAKAMIPYYANVVLKIGPVGYGWLNAAIDIGAIIVVVLLIIFPIKKAQGRKMMYSVAGFGLCIIAFAVSEVFLLSFFAMLIAGMLDGVSVVVRGTVMQLKTPDEMRGRVSSVSSMFIQSSNELGQFESGVAARAMGEIPSVLFGGCMTLLVVGITWFKAPTLRKLEY
ncbi:MAG: MFS transporter [Chitinophagaceae bacterium]